MSRSGYCDDIDPWLTKRWRGQVASAIRGKRGQQLLRDMLAGMDALPEKRLVRGELTTGETGVPFALKRAEVCAMGAAAQLRGVDLIDVDPEDYDTVAEKLNVAYQLACEVAYWNDEVGYHYTEGRHETPEERWVRMRAWIVKHLQPVDLVEIVE